MRPPALALCAALLAAACGSPAPYDGPDHGRVRVNLNGTTRKPSSAALVSLPPLCADFILAPYSLSASGQQTPAGAPLTFTTASASGTLSILGCVDTLQGQDDWGYRLTASNFHPCTGTLPPGVTVAPSAVTVAKSFDCIAGQDAAADLSVAGSYAVPDSTGYIDISVAVEAGTVEVGCKQADFDPKNPGFLHFGEAFTWSSGFDGVVPDGVVGLSDGAAAPQQWAGQISWLDQHSQYYTGIVPIPAGSAVHLVQTLAVSCAGQPGAVYSAAQHPACVTDAAFAASGGNATTSASLLDAFVSGPLSEGAPAGWAGASLSTDALVITTSLAALAIPAGPGSMALPAPRYTTTLPTQPVSVPGLTGVWPSNQGFEFLFTAAVAGVPTWGLVGFDGTTWAIRVQHPIEGLSYPAMACLGLFGFGGAPPSGCHQPASCQSLLAHDFP